MLSHPSPKWIDTHNHLHDPRIGKIDRSLVDALKKAGVGYVVVNGTSENDWPAVAELARRFPDFVWPSFGLHPWHSSRCSQRWHTSLTRYLEEFPRAGIGEMGLDRWMANPNLEEQRRQFIAQWELAVQWERPISLHCLKAWDELFALWADLPPYPGRVLIHGFTGSREIARRLWHREYLLGFGGGALLPKKVATREAFREAPAEALLLETDAPDMAAPEGMRTHFFSDRTLNHPGNLVSYGNALAELRGQASETLRLQLHNNTLRWLGIKHGP